MKTIEQRIYDANRAKEVLENEAFNAAFDDTEKEIIEQWTNSPARDSEGREKLHTYLMLLRKVKAHLSYSLETGKLAKLDLEHLEQKKSLKEQIGTALSELW